MTKARDTANLVATGVPNSLITLDAAEIPNISTDKLTSGTLPDARIADLAATKLTGTVDNARISLDAAEIPSLATSKITSGTFADARISAGSVTQHVAATDLQPLKADLTALALREATNEASAAFNLPNQFIDTFATDVLATKTDIGIADGHVSTVSAGSETEFDYAAASGSGIIFTKVGTHTWGSSNNVGSSSNNNHNIYNPSTYGHVWHTNGNNVGGGFSADYLTAYRWTKFMVSKEVTAGDITGIQIYHSDDGSTWTGFNLTGSTQTKVNYGGGSPVSTDLSNFASDGSMDWGGFPSNTAPHHSHNTVTDFTPVTKRYLKLVSTALVNLGNWNCGYGKFRWWYTPQTFSATGTAIQATNTVGSAKTKVGGTMLYKDESGTATLGTDLKIYFSCNNGGAWTEAASYNAITPVYSTGIKQVRLGETTCTSGTGVIYKAVWANQASGSKETQLHGIGINY